MAKYFFLTSEKFNSKPGNCIVKTTLPVKSALFRLKASTIPNDCKVSFRLTNDLKKQHKFDLIMTYSKALVSMGAAGAIAPMVSKSLGASTHGFW